MTLSNWSTPWTALLGSGFFAGFVEFAGEGAVEDVVDKGGFPGAGDAGNDCHDAYREMGGDVLEVVGGGVLDGEPAPVEGPWSFVGSRPGDDIDGAGEVLAGDGGRVGHDFGGGAGGHELAAVFAGARA